MSGIGIEVLKIALVDAVKNQKLISENIIKKKPVSELVDEQTKLLESIVLLLDRIS
jgi:hypothetical protein